jgi:hypothetical protein
VRDFALPASVTSIGAYAFSNASKMNIIFADGFAPTSIGEGAFYSCPNLTSFPFSAGITELSPYLFYGTGITSLTIPSYITSIGSYAFQNTDITSVAIPETVTQLGDGVFKGCTALTGAEFTGTTTITALPAEMFSGCSSLTGFTLPASMTEIGASVFMERA